MPNITRLGKTLSFFLVVGEATENDNSVRSPELRKQWNKIPWKKPCRSKSDAMGVLNIQTEMKPVATERRDVVRSSWCRSPSARLPSSWCPAIRLALIALGVSYILFISLKVLQEVPVPPIAPTVTILMGTTRV